MMCWRHQNIFLEKADVAKIIIVIVLIFKSGIKAFITKRGGLELSR